MSPDCRQISESVHPRRPDEGSPQAPKLDHLTNTRFFLGGVAL
jgi:hypothetical protein